MPRRNKKKLNRFIFPVPFIGIVLVISIFALGYVWMKSQCDFLGNELKNLEVEKKALLRNYSYEAYKWTERRFNLTAILSAAMPRFFESRDAVSATLLLFAIVYGSAQTSLASIFRARILRFPLLS